MVSFFRRDDRTPSRAQRVYPAAVGRNPDPDGNGAAKCCGGNGHMKKPAKVLQRSDAAATASAKSTRAAQLAASNQSVEDYLERIHELIEEHGYARPIEIAAALGIKQSSVTK